MSVKKLSLSGMPDFSSLEVKRRDYIFSIVKTIFEKFGFSPLETPAFEKRDVLMGKYGNEGDKLIYQVLKSGDFTSKLNTKDFERLNYKNLSSLISDKALRYDLTIPFARYVIENQSDILFPFKRYQIQKVWRADRPQRGRLREFTQCDVDIIGSNSLWLEFDLIKLYDEIFNELGIRNIVFKINNRKILQGLFSCLKLKCSFVEFCVSIDKIEKTGFDKFLEFLSNNGCENLKLINNLFLDKKNNKEKMSFIDCNFNDKGLKEGIIELSTIIDRVEEISLNSALLEFDISLARGLDYYTGAIFEIIYNNLNIGSLGGGGRYDKLTQLFGSDVGSGVGISLGIDRIYICLEEQNLFPKNLESTIDVLFVNLGDQEALRSQFCIDELRKNNIISELFPDNVKLKKQMSYSNKRGARYTALIGEKELNSKKITLRDMNDGSQENLTLVQLIKKVKK